MQYFPKGNNDQVEPGLESGRAGKGYLNIQALSLHRVFAIFDKCGSSISYINSVAHLQKGV